MSGFIYNDQEYGLESSGAAWNLVVQRAGGKTAVVAAGACRLQAKIQPKEACSSEPTSSRHPRARQRMSGDGMGWGA